MPLKIIGRNLLNGVRHDSSYTQALNVWYIYPYLAIFMVND